VVFQFQPKEQAKELTDTTDFSRVVLQFLPKEQAKELTDTTTLVAWFFNFYLTFRGQQRLKLNLHATKVSGIPRTSEQRPFR
jgi:hypothetical protein